MNVLISSAGRRTSLVELFRQALSEVGGSVIAVDTDPLAPALLTADIAELVPRVDSPTYERRLVDLCAELSVDVVVPTIDTELPILASLAKKLKAAGTTTLVSDEKLIEITADKRATEATFGSSGIRTPRSWSVDDLATEDLPERVFVKPARGSSSLHTYSLEKSELDSVLPMVPDPIVQEHIDAAEVTVDALLDMRGDVIHFVPRIRLKTVGGESVQGVTVPDVTIRDWVMAVLNVVSEQGGLGPITIQMFLTETEPTLVEVNPRFGGGFPLAARAGGDYPLWIVQMLSGERVSPRVGDYEVGLFMSRSLSEFYRPGGWT